MDDLIHHATEAARIAGKTAMQHFRGHLGIDFKADESPVTQADRDVERRVRDYLLRYFPDHGVFGEEYGSDGLDRKHLWIIDPIDGTRSFLSGHPLFGFLLGHLIDGEAQIGIVGMPAMQELYVGVQGQGASLNGAPIKVSGQTNLETSILYINEPERMYRDQPKVFDRLVRSAQTRRFSYDCYPYALLASGHIDVLVDYGLEPYDFLPVSVLIEAAGGVMTDWQGKPLTLESEGRVVAAATPELHSALLNIVNG